jgi:hypothetical protein
METGRGRRLSKLFELDGILEVIRVAIAYLLQGEFSKVRAFSPLQIFNT